MTKTNELNALLKKMIGQPMTKEQREESERLKEQVKRGVWADRTAHMVRHTALRCYLPEILVYELVLEFLALISWVFSIFSLIAHSMNC
jgi:hypothetical protein